MNLYQSVLALQDFIKEDGIKLCPICKAKLGEK